MKQNKRSHYTDAQLSHAQTGHIRSEHIEDIGLYSRRDELQDPNFSRERSMEKPLSISQIFSNIAPNSSSGTSIERLAESSSRNAPLKMALPKPVVSKAPLFDAYLESSRLSDDDDDIQAAPAPKDREGLRLFAESKALMTCFDLTNFFILAEFAI